MINDISIIEGKPDIFINVDQLVSVWDRLNKCMVDANGGWCNNCRFKDEVTITNTARCRLFGECLSGADFMHAYRYFKCIEMFGRDRQ